MSYTLIIKQGKTFRRRFEYHTGTPPIPFDFSGYEARGQIKPNFGSSTVYCTFTSTDTPSDGTGLDMTPLSGSVILPRSSGSISLEISAYSSSRFNFDNAYFDIEFYSGSGHTQYVKELISGKVKVLKEVTTIE